MREVTVAQIAGSGLADARVHVRGAIVSMGTSYELYPDAAAAHARDLSACVALVLSPHDGGKLAGLYIDTATIKGRVLAMDTLSIDAGHPAKINGRAWLGTFCRSANILYVDKLSLPAR